MKIKSPVILTVALLSGAFVTLVWLAHPGVTMRRANGHGERSKAGLAAADPAPSPLLHLINQPHLVTVHSTTPSAKPAARLNSSSEYVDSFLNPNTAFEARMEDLDLLGSRISEADWKRLQKFLLQADPLDKVQLNQVLKNRLMDVLCAMDPALPDLGELLRDIYKNPDQNEVVRDYAVQHLATYYQLADGQIASTEEQAIRETLWGALTETQTSIAGTALLALNRLSQEFTDIDRSQLATQAVSLAKDLTAGELTHVSALQVCARMSLADALPLAIAAANSGETVAVKMSAINVIGQTGDAGQVTLLKQFLSTADGRLQMAAQTALQKIAVRTGSR